MHIIPATSSKRIPKGAHPLQRSMCKLLSGPNNLWNTKCLQNAIWKKYYSSIFYVLH